MAFMKPFPIADESGAASAATPITVVAAAGEKIDRVAGASVPFRSKPPTSLSSRAQADDWLLVSG